MRVGVWVVGAVGTRGGSSLDKQTRRRSTVRGFRAGLEGAQGCKKGQGGRRKAGEEEEKEKEKKHTGTGIERGCACARCRRIPCSAVCALSGCAPGLDTRPDFNYAVQYTPLSPFTTSLHNVTPHRHHPQQLPPPPSSSSSSVQTPSGARRRARLRRGCGRSAGSCPGGGGPAT